MAGDADHNPYSPPKAEVTDIPESSAAGSAPFFVTGIGKMVLLYVATMGAYSVYWYYKQWDHRRTHRGEKVSPAARAIFAVFFITTLFRRVTEEVKKADGLQGLAWLLITLSILERVVDKVAENSASPLMVLVTLAMAMAPIPIFVKVQRLINGAAPGRAVENNSRISLWNILFIVLGLVMWFFYMFAMLVDLGMITLPE